MTATTRGPLYGTLRPGRIPDQIIQILTLDGGWLSTHGLHADLPHVTLDSISRAVHRLYRLGYLQKRTRELNGRGWGGPATYIEWRAVSTRPR